MFKEILIFQRPLIDGRALTGRTLRRTNSASGLDMPSQPSRYESGGRRVCARSACVRSASGTPASPATPFAAAQARRDHDPSAGRSCAPRRDRGLAGNFQRSLLRLKEPIDPLCLKSMPAQPHRAPAISAGRMMPPTAPAAPSGTCRSRTVASDRRNACQTFGRTPY